MVAPSSGELSAERVLAELEAALRDGAFTPDRLDQRISAIKRLQRLYRREPVGGRLLWLKRLVYWFTASSFDRQGKVIEAIIDAMGEMHRGMTERRPAQESPTITPKDSPPWEPILWPNWEPLIPKRPLWVDPNVPVVHFFRWTWEYRAYLTLLCEMKQDSSVLELACSHGRTMLGLIDFLKPPGRYEGLDILPAQIEFAQSRIHSAYPHFNFTLADVHNDVYNPAGKQPADRFRFPYPDGSFDIAYAASLFTHLLPEAAANYFRESRRVLKKGGRCLFSFFIKDYYRGTGTSSCALYEFDYPLHGHPGVATHDPDRPELVIAYELVVVRRMAQDAGLELERVVPGAWSRNVDCPVHEHELVLLRAI